jgi:hypothetical protein
MLQQADIQNLMVNYSRQLQKLKEQEALLGLTTPPAILLQIEDVEAKLEALQKASQNVKGNSEPTFSITGSIAAEIEQESARLKMSEPLPHQPQVGNINVNSVHSSPISINQSTKIDTGGGGAVFGNKTVINQDRPENALQTSPQASLEAALARWQYEIEAKIAALTELEADEKEELQEKVIKVAEEVAKGIEANPGKLERLINTMSAMAPDIIEVTAKILQNPLAGVGLVLEKINDKAIELKRQSSSTVP